MAKDVSQVQSQQASAKPPVNPTERLNTWPHFLIIEFIGLMVFLLLLIAAASAFRAPLLELAEPTRTPNPAKAPWYFLSLQELLLHMNASLAGVIVPTVIIVLIAAIPYIDKDERGLGIWFTTRKGVEIFRFSFLYTTVWVLALIFFDEFIGTRQLLGMLGLSGPVVGLIAGWVIPIIVMTVIYAWLALIIRRRWNGDNRHVIIGLFTVFVASFIILTFIGTLFRGEDLLLVWPWELNLLH